MSLLRSWVNGRDGQSVGIQDRGLQYGDGLFETVRIEGGQRQFWSRHWQRLVTGVERLGINLDTARLQQELDAFCGGVDSGILKIIISRGEGGRGYAYASEMTATRIIMLYPLSSYPESYYLQGIALMTCKTRMACHSPLAGLKHLNRLESVLARHEWLDEFQEGVMLNFEGQVVEGTMTNLFAVHGDELLTPELSGNGVRGVIRDMICDAAAAEAIICRETELTLRDLQQADELFVCNSVIGIWPVRLLDSVQYQAPGPRTQLCMRWLENNKRES